MAEKKEKEEKVQLGPTLREGEIAIGVCHIFASFNDTFIHVTDLSGRETLVRVTGGMKVTRSYDCSRLLPAYVIAMISSIDVPPCFNFFNEIVIQRFLYL